MPKDKPELTSHELIREAREALAAPPFDETPGGPTVQELLAAPESKATRHGASTDPSAWSYFSVSPSSELLSSESLLLRRSADLWTNDRSDSRDTSAPSVTPAEAELPTLSEIAAPAMELSLLPAPPEHWPPPVPAAMTAPQRLAPPQPWVATAPPGSVPPPPPAMQPGRALEPLGPPAMQAAKRRGLSWRWILLGAIGLAGIIGAVAGSGTTSVSQIELGDCFEDLGTSSNSVRDQDCAGHHEVQVYAELQAGHSLANCDLELATILGSDHMGDGSVIVPDDTLISQIGGPTIGQGNAFCLLTSPSGSLFGSVLPE
ncbi:MAG: hypothetical protein ACKVIQ_19405 [Acidimicrobiales bacterium]